MTPTGNEFHGVGVSTDPTFVLTLVSGNNTETTTRLLKLVIYRLCSRRVAFLDAVIYACNTQVSCANTALISNLLKLDDSLRITYN